jgi:hypothetical protein
MLPINSTNDVVPGGPVSSVAGANEIFSGVETTKPSDEKLAGARSTIVGAGFLAGAFDTARRILQHSVPPGSGCCFAGLEWNGQPVCAVSVFVVNAWIAQ